MSDEGTFKHLYTISDELLTAWRLELIELTTKDMYEQVVEAVLTNNCIYAHIKHCWSKDEFMEKMSEEWNRILTHIETCDCRICQRDRLARAMVESGEVPKQ